MEIFSFAVEFSIRVYKNENVMFTILTNAACKEDYNAKEKKIKLINF